MTQHATSQYTSIHLKNGPTLEKQTYLRCTQPCQYRLYLSAVGRFRYKVNIKAQDMSHIRYTLGGQLRYKAHSYKVHDKKKTHRLHYSFILAYDTS